MLPAENFSMACVYNYSIDGSSAGRDCTLPGKTTTYLEDALALKVPYLDLFGHPCDLRAVGCQIIQARLQRKDDQLAGQIVHFDYVPGSVHLEAEGDFDRVGRYCGIYLKSCRIDLKDRQAVRPLRGRWGGNCGEVILSPIRLAIEFDIAHPQARIVTARWDVAIILIVDAILVRPRHPDIAGDPCVLNALAVVQSLPLIRPEHFLRARCDRYGGRTV